MGGMSIEREVSFNSGRTICDHLDTQFFRAIPLFQTDQGLLYILPWTFLYRGKIADFYDRLPEQAQLVTWDELPHLIDFMYIAVHGKYGEDGRLQAMLELLKIPYLGSKMFACALSMDKEKHNQFLASHGILVPHGFALSVPEITNFDDQVIDQKLQEHRLQFPLIVKPVGEGSSFGVFVVKSRSDLQKAVQIAAFMSDDQGQKVLIEEKVVGMEFTCIVITDLQTGKLRALPPTQVLVSKNKDIFDYEQKYMPGAVHERTPAGCSNELLVKIQETSIAVMQLLGFTNLARIDGFVTEQGEVIIIDSNPLSGMGPATFLFRQAAEVNMSHTQIINHLIMTELKNYKIPVCINDSTTMKQSRLKVGILLGGPSNEREISLESGRNVVYKLSPEKYEVFPIFMSQASSLHLLDQRTLVCHSTQEITDQLDSLQAIGWSDLPKLVDFVFISLHGAPGEDGTVQGALEMLRLPYNGSGVFTSALCMDKFKTNQFLATQGFDVPQGLLLSYEQWLVQDAVLDQFVAQVGFPCIVKPHDDGCSVMVTCPENRQELDAALQEIFMNKQFALIEEKITGMELTVGVIGNEKPHALVPSQTVVKGALLSLAEKFLPGAGENQTPALLPAEDLQFVRKTIERVYQVVGCKGYARIDCFMQYRGQSKRLVVLEINSLPGMTPATCIFHQAAEEGMRPMEFIDKIIELGLQAHAQSQIVSTDQALKIQHSMQK